MAVEEIAGDVFCNDCLVRFQRIEVSVAKQGCDLEADVDELPEMQVVGRVALIVAEGTGELIAGPVGDFAAQARWYPRKGRASPLCLLGTRPSSSNSQPRVTEAGRIA